MAYEVGNHAISVPASADLSAKQFLFGTIDASGQVAVTGGWRRWVSSSARRPGVPTSVHAPW